MLKSLGKLFNVVICKWLLNLCVLGLMIFAVSDWITYYRARGWIEHKGVISELYAVRYRNAQEEIFSVNQWNPGDGIVHISYVYDYLGELYQGETFSSDGLRNVELKISDLATAYNGNEDIPVYVAPDEPANSMLFRHATSDMYFVTALCVFWFTASAYAALKERMRKRSKLTESEVTDS